MVIGKHECANARDTDLKRALDIGLDEALTALQEAFTGLAALEGMTEASLRRQVDWHPDKSVPAGFYIRAIYHTMPHVRQIWLLRGAMGAAGGLAWPRQHWA